MCPPLKVTNASYVLQRHRQILFGSLTSALNITLGLENLSNLRFNERPIMANGESCFDFLCNVEERVKEPMKI